MGIRIRGGLGFGFGLGWGSDGREEGWVGVDVRAAHAAHPSEALRRHQGSPPARIGAPNATLGEGERGGSAVCVRGRPPTEVGGVVDWPCPACAGWMWWCCWC